jgi:hypothetical protein
VAYDERAVQLSAVRIAALYEMYVSLVASDDFIEAWKKRFESIVRDADLSCPLPGGNLETAKRELTKKTAGGAKHKPLFEAS